ncbi:MAG: hypothetical protein U0892_06315 [Pirellulales bacterium]
MHRFIPILAHWRGGCWQIVTKSITRVSFGKTKYGLSRTIRVVLDLLTVKYMLDYYQPDETVRPRRFQFLTLGCAMLFATLAAKLIGGMDMTGNPLLLMGAMLCIVSVQLFSVGLLGEANTRYYSRSLIVAPSPFAK